MAALLALTAAAAYGAGDFLGGVAARRVPATAVVLWSHVIGLAAMVLIAPWLGGQPTHRAMIVGALAGVAGSVAVALCLLSRVGALPAVSRMEPRLSK